MSDTMLELLYKFSVFTFLSVGALICLCLWAAFFGFLFTLFRKKNKPETPEREEIERMINIYENTVLNKEGYSIRDGMKALLDAGYKRGSRSDD